MFAEVAIPKTNLDTLTYSIPAHLSALITPGSLVKIELKKKEMLGIVIEKSETTQVSYTKDILAVVETEFVSADLLSLLIWAKRYYMANWGQVLNLTLPQSVYQYKSKPANITTQTEYIAKLPTQPLSESSQIRKIGYCLKHNQSKIFLLFNPDYQDSIEIYLGLIAQSLRLNKSTIILVPEIILTPKFISRFQERFGTNLFCLHSGLKRTERRQIWHTLRNQEYSVVFGTRSAIFAPVRNLGLIIVDREHDLSYKEQERHFHYNARDLAVVRAQISKAVTVLASATPSCETYHNASIRKYELVTIAKPVKKIKDRVLLIDLRRSKDKIFSAPLRYELKANYAKNKLSVLFLNRRGYARIITCLDCGYVPKCPECGIPLVFHQADNRFSCNICKHQQPAFDFCPQCRGTDFSYQGLGTQKVMSEIKKIIRNAQILRLDADTRKNSKFPSQNSKFTGILITTRLGIRDLDYSQIGLLGIISADTSLLLEDFRASEKTFQELSKLIQQSSVNKDCKVIIQTYHPDHYAIYRAVQENYQKFYEQEINLRKKLNYPPYSRLAIVRVSAPNLANVQKVTDRIIKQLSAIKDISVLGPTPLPRKPRFQTYQLLVKLKPNQSFANLISRKALLDDNADIDINIDPL